MSKIIKSEAELDKLLGEDSGLFVLFYSPFCPFCRSFMPVFEKYSKGNESRFCRVSVDELPECEEKYSIEIVPTVIYFKGGHPAKRLDGIKYAGISETKLSALISSCK